MNDKPRVLASRTSATHTRVRRMNSWLCARPSALSPTPSWVRDIYLRQPDAVAPWLRYPSDIRVKGIHFSHPLRRRHVIQPTGEEAVWLGALALYQGLRASSVAGSDRGHWLVATGVALTAGGPQSSLVEARGNQRAACATRQT